MVGWLFLPLVDIPSGPCNSYIPLGLQIMTFHILASNLCMAYCASGEYVTLYIPPFFFPGLYYTSVVDVFYFGERQTFACRMKGRGSTPQSFRPPGGERNEGWEGRGGLSRVQRCKTHWDTALASVKTVDFFPFHSLSFVFCCLWGQKACKYWLRTIETTIESIFKMSGHRLESEAVGKCICYLVLW